MIPTRRSGLIACLTCLTLVRMPAIAFAGQHCVICNGPDHTYLCESQNGPGILAANGGQLACITELAKRGGHDTCSVIKREGARCEGLTPVVLYPGSGPEAAPDTAAAPLPAADGASSPPGTATSATDTYSADDATAGSEPGRVEPEPAAAPPKGPPKTVEELAGRTYESSKKGLQKAGKTVGDGAKAAGKAVTNTAKKTGEQIGKAGKAVGNVAQKTWNCVTSLFSDC